MVGPASFLHKTFKQVTGLLTCGNLVLEVGTRLVEALPQSDRLAVLVARWDGLVQRDRLDGREVQIGIDRVDDAAQGFLQVDPQG